MKKNPTVTLMRELLTAEAAKIGSTLEKNEVNHFLDAYDNLIKTIVENSQAVSLDYRIYVDYVDITIPKQLATVLEIPFDHRYRLQFAEILSDYFSLELSWVTKLRGPCGGVLVHSSVLRSDTCKFAFAKMLKVVRDDGGRPVPDVH